MNKLYQLTKKYSEESVKIIKTVETVSELKARQIELFKKFMAIKNKIISRHE